MLIFEGGGCLPASTFPHPRRRALMLVFEGCGSLPAPPCSCWLSSSATTFHTHHHRKRACRCLFSVIVDPVPHLTTTHHFTTLHHRYFPSHTIVTVVVY